MSEQKTEFPTLPFPQRQYDDPPPDLFEALDKYGDAFVAMTKNRHGETLVFIGDRDPTDRCAWLYHGDANWDEYEVVDGEARGLILDRGEQAWLLATWALFA